MNAANLWWRRAGLALILGTGTADAQQDGKRVPYYSVLISHAAARGQTLLDAAREVLTEMNETACILLDTEQLKDAWSVRIAGVESFKDIDDLGRAIARLRLPARTAPQAKVTEGGP